MNSTVTVVAAENKTTKVNNKPYVAFTDSTGTKWTSWDAKLWQLIRPGAQFDIEWEQDGKYQNIKSMTFKGEVEPPPPQEPAISHEKLESNLAMNARNNLTALDVVGKLSDGLHLALVSQLCSFAGLLFDGTYKEKGGHVVAAVEKAGGVKKGMDVPLEEPPIKAKGQFANVGAFLNRCHQEYGLQRPQVEALLGEPISAKTDLDGAWLMVVSAGTK